jgi:alkanesulfonate monooxygenase SsuD/methylene tetrahydromethanopterin reductase-like flavin-dependent oxidoreductase (luciferase family)
VLLAITEDAANLCGAFSSRRLLRLVGEVADGWYPASFYSLPIFGERVKIISETAIRANRSPATIGIIANVPTLVCRTEDEVRETKQEIKRKLKCELLGTQYLFRNLGHNNKVEFTKSLPEDLEYPNLQCPDRGTKKRFKKPFKGSP